MKHHRIFHLNLFVSDILYGYLSLESLLQETISLKKEIYFPKKISVLVLFFPILVYFQYLTVSLFIMYFTF